MDTRGDGRFSRSACISLHAASQKNFPHPPISPTSHHKFDQREHSLWEKALSNLSALVTPASVGKTQLSRPLTFDLAPAVAPEISANGVRQQQWLLKAPSAR
jgi:hypothetical protein